MGVLEKQLCKKKKKKEVDSYNKIDEIFCKRLCKCSYNPT